MPLQQSTWRPGDRIGRFEDCLSGASSAETPYDMRANRKHSRPELSASDTGKAGAPKEKQKNFKLPIDTVGEWCYSDTNIKQESRTETVGGRKGEQNERSIHSKDFVHVVLSNA